ncbi:MAG: hypothetical protein QG559_1049 [Campylobacterota bacterium]|nr:hypothetical protein [Campylobacterota bacterium]MDQ1264048.1 hypothetical protein [Campylobacterota bacterium]MDQ1337784.1 hypothetical protein [Campylobacterota bacterium]
MKDIKTKRVVRKTSIFKNEDDIFSEALKEHKPL